MHLYFTTRGIKMHVDNFITQLQGKYLPFKYNGKDSAVQVAVRPVQMWEVVFPKEHLDLMLTTCLGPDGKPYHKRHNKFIAVVRKVLGVKKIPKYDNSSMMICGRDHIDSTGIGIKEDANDNNGNEGL